MNFEYAGEYYVCFDIINIYLTICAYIIDIFIDGLILTVKLVHDNIAVSFWLSEPFGQGAIDTVHFVLENNVFLC